MMPAVPEERLERGGWSLVEESTETLVRLPAARALGYTRLYEDAALRARIREAAGIDRRWRFFFATRLTFAPPLPAGVGPALLLPTVTAEVRRTFADDLRERGFRGVERGRTEQVRVRSGGRARLQSFRARLPLDVDGRSAAVPVEGWIGVWAADGEFRVAGGAYPTDLPELGAALGVEAGPAASACRAELFELLRAVS
ncbi:hypothetical protein ACFQPA_08360 [Halomarina halobia]|uniref:Uncharacterized protein n=1 Tax=Halomarina halobia TaxID=3033386 RepID=A0ABD6ABV9_9EURY|nr:hypothetical protein [Halomarina sp. PSR21]